MAKIVLGCFVLQVQTAAAPSICWADSAAAHASSCHMYSLYCSFQFLL